MQCPWGKTLSLAVIIASCNREERAFSTAQSLLDKEMGEVIVIDDGSRVPYQSRNSQAGPSLFRLPVNSGPSAARNHGVRNSHAEWLMFLDDDDSLEPRLIDWIHAHASTGLNNLDLVHFGHKTVDQDSKASSAITLSSNEKITVLAGSWMMRRAFFVNLGGYEEQLRYSENSDLIERASLAGARTLHAGFPTLCYTVGRPKRKEEVAERRAEACVFYLRNRPHCNRKQTLKIGLMNSWWDRNPLIAFRLVAAFLLTRLDENRV